MRNRALALSILLLSCAAAAPAAAQVAVIDPPAEEAPLSLSASVGTSEAWLFNKQGYTYTDERFDEVSVTLSTASGTSFGVWYGKAGAADEVDYTVSQDLAFGAAEVNLTAGYYFADGDKIYDLNATVSYPVGPCGLSGYAEIARNDFVDNVVMLEGSCSRDLSDRVSLDGALGVAHSTWAAENVRGERAVPADEWEDGVNVPFEVGLDWQVSDRVSLRFYTKGYTGPNGQDAIGGLALTLGS